MSWWKGSDDMMLNRKVQGLLQFRSGYRAFALHISALCYVAGQLTDGHLSPSDVRVAAGLAHVSPNLAALLVDVGLWEQDGVGYAIHDYLMYNLSAEKVKERRAKGARRQQEWRRKDR